MNEWFNLARRSICAGLLIGCAGFAYSMTGGALGAFLIGCNIPRMLTVKEE